MLVPGRSVTAWPWTHTDESPAAAQNGTPVALQQIELQLRSKVRGLRAGELAASIHTLALACATRVAPLAFVFRDHASNQRYIFFPE